MAGEDAGAGRALGEAHQQQVVALVLVEAGAAGRELDAGDGAASSGTARRWARRARPGLPVGVAAGAGAALAELARLAVGAAQRGALQRAAQRIERALQGLADDLGGLGAAASGAAWAAAWRAVGSLLSARRWSWRRRRLAAARRAIAPVPGGGAEAGSAGAPGTSGGGGSRISILAWLRSVSTRSLIWS